MEERIDSKFVSYRKPDSQLTASAGFIVNGADVSLETGTILHNFEGGACATNVAQFYVPAISRNVIRGRLVKKWKQARLSKSCEIKTVNNPCSKHYLEALEDLSKSEPALTERCSSSLLNIDSGCIPNQDRKSANHSGEGIGNFNHKGSQADVLGIQDQISCCTTSCFAAIASDTGSHNSRNHENTSSLQETVAEELYDVESIVAVHIQNDGSWIYRVRWLGYSAEEDTWEPSKHLDSFYLNSVNQCINRALELTGNAATSFIFSELAGPTNNNQLTGSVISIPSLSTSAYDSYCNLNSSTFLASFNDIVYHDVSFVTLNEAIEALNSNTASILNSNADLGSFTRHFTSITRSDNPHNLDSSPSSCDYSEYDNSTGNDNGSQCDFGNIYEAEGYSRREATWEPERNLVSEALREEKPRVLRKYIRSRRQRNLNLPSWFLS